MNDINYRKGATFLILCKNAYLKGIHPFDLNISQTESYKNLTNIVQQYKSENKLTEFTGFLMEGQYYINLYASFFILNSFQPDIEDKLIGLNDEKSIVEDCIETVDRYAKGFETKSQIENYNNWISKIKSYYNIKSKSDSLCCIHKS